MSDLTDIQIAYTMLAQGIKGRPQTLKASVYQNMIYTNAVGGTLNVEIGQSIIFPIKTWSGMTEYNTWINNPQNSENFFFPQKIINNIHGLNIRGHENAGGTILIQPFDENGTIITNLGNGNTAPPFLAYEAHCVDVIGVTQDRLEQPITLTLVANIEARRCYFSFFAPFSHSRTNEYNIPSNVQCHLNSGAGGAILIGNMIDPADVADPEGGAPTGDEDGGGGLFDYPYTPIGEPALPTVSICDTGMISLYTVSPSDMYQLAQKLWSQNFFDTIIKNFQSPMDNIVSLHVVPFNVYAATQRNITIGNYDTEIPSNMLTTTYFDIDCGIIELTGAYKTFADYAPFTDLALYLPYIGIVPISPDDIMNGAINVKYHIDVFSGACVAFVMSLIRGQWTVLNQYEGNILTQFPITGADYTNVYVGAMQVANTAIQTGMQVATAPSAVNSVSAATNGITQGISQAMQAKPTFQRSGNITSAAGLMGVQTPYLIITKPNYIQAKDFRAMKGYVSNLSCTIGEESGFISASVNNEQLTSINATQDEKNMLRQLLAEGVYI